MKHKVVVHACMYAADIIETQDDVDDANKDFEPWIDENDTKHGVFEIDDDISGWDLLEEEEIVGLEDEYATDEEAYEAFNKVKKGAATENDKAWRIAKFGFELIKPWMREQFDIDGDVEQIAEILQEKLNEAVKEALAARKSSD